MQARLERHRKALEEIHKAFTTDPASWSIDRNTRYENLAKSIKEEEDLWLELTVKIDGLSRQIDGMAG